MNLKILKQLAHPENYGGVRSARQIKYLVIHYTGNDGDSAAGNAAYFQKNVVKTSAHYFVDSSAIYQSVPDLWTAWAVGGKKYANADRTGGGRLYGIVTNTNSISVELCDTVRDGTYQATEMTLASAAALCRGLMASYGIPLERVVRHFDVTGKHCPSYFVNPQKWASFKTRLTEENSMDLSQWTDADIRRLAERMQQVLGHTPVGPALTEELEEAVAKGITDGTAPGAPATRGQAAVMALRASKL